MRWLITGGCGFIGRNLIAGLVAEGGHDIRVVDNFSSATPGELASYAGATVHVRRPGEPAPGGNAAVDVVEADILDGAAMAEVAAQRDVLVHLAANTGVAPSVADPMFDCLVNVQGTLNCLEAARHAGAHRFVFASSGAPLGNVEPPLHEGLAPRPVSPYGASKLAGEGYCSAYAQTFGLDTVALRFGNVYGPGSTHKSSVVAKFIREALAGQAWEIYGDGTQTRDFIFIGDLVRAIRLAASGDGVAGEVFQIATSVERSVGELAAELAAALGRHGIAAPPVGHGERRLGDVARNFSDTRKAREVLRWTCDVDLPAGLDRTVAWFLAPDRP